MTYSSFTSLPTCPANASTTETTTDIENWQIYLQIILAVLLILSELIGVAPCDAAGILDFLIKLLRRRDQQ